MNYYRLLAITVVLSLLTWGFMEYMKQPLIKNADSTGTNVIAFGDSLVFGVGSTEGNDMFSVTSRELGIPIINKGVPGNTTADGLERLQRDVLDNDPRIVFVLLGGNDFLQHFATSTTFTNLETIISAIQDRGAAVILVGVRGGLITDHYEKNYEELAKKYQTGYVSNILDGLITNRELMYDSIHPNDRGYKIAAHRLEAALQQVLDEGVAQ